MIRILHVVGDLDYGGIQQMLINYQSAVDEDIQFNYAVMCDAVGGLETAAISMGASVWHVPNFLRGQGRAFLRVFDELLSIEHFDVVHAHLDKRSDLPLLIARHHGIPMRAIHAHSISESPKLYRHIAKHAFRAISHLAATHRLGCSPEACAFLYGRADAKSAIVVKNAVDTRKFLFDENRRKQVREELGIKGLCVGNVGRLSTHKNQYFLIDVFSKLIENGIEATLLLVGPPAGNEDMQKYIEKRGCAGHVMATGLVDNPEDFLNAMDVFCFPSLYEGLGMAAVEAQLNGLPVIASTAVPASAAITNLVDFLELDAGSRRWAEFLARSKQRASITAEDAAATGYELSSAGSVLSELYRRGVFYGC